MEIHDIVKKLVGPISPVGCSTRDEERFENLKAMCELASKIITEIDRVGYENRNSMEYSVKKASDYATKYLTESIGIKD